MPRLFYSGPNNGGERVESEIEASGPKDARAQESQAKNDNLETSPKIKPDNLDVVLPVIRVNDKNLLFPCGLAIYRDELISFRYGLLGTRAFLVIQVLGLFILYLLTSVAMALILP
jgi:hypothetical protein